LKAIPQHTMQVHGVLQKEIEETAARVPIKQAVQTASDTSSGGDPVRWPSGEGESNFALAPGCAIGVSATSKRSESPVRA